MPVPFDATERETLASVSRERLFENQKLDPITGPLTLYEATARAIKYQADYRVKIMEEATTLGQLDVARFDMLPKLTANAGYSWRNNDAFGFGFTPQGTVAVNPSASVERIHNTASIGFAWNVLDFGVSYFRAKQLADQTLIYEERRRKAMQNLVQDVRLAYWRAQAAQRLLPMIDRFYEEIDETIEKTRVIESRKLLPPLQTASLRRALLDLAQQISLRREELTQARIELASMVNAEPGSDVRVVETPQTSIVRLDLKTSADALESIALRNRPELAEEAYRTRWNESDAKKALLGLFPNFSVALDGNYDSNKFLVNNTWYSMGLGAAFNLVKAFSLPALNRSNEAQRQLDESRRLAMAMAILTQTRVAAVRYGLMMQEFEVWDEATRDDDQIVKFLSSSAEVGIDTELELVRARARYLVSQINRDLMYANLEAALGRIYTSMGLDALPDSIASSDTSAVAAEIQSRIERWQSENFVQRAATEELPVAVGDIEGVPAEATAEFRKALSDILEASRLTVTQGDNARLRVVAGVRLQPLRDGGQPATIRITVTDVRTGAVRFTTELKTTLSEPVDAEQWRTLGEAVAYRVVGPVLRLQAGRGAAPKVSALPAVPPKSGALAEAAQNEFSAGGSGLSAEPFEDEPLVLKLDSTMTWPALRNAVARDE